MDSPWVLPAVTAVAMTAVLLGMYQRRGGGADSYAPPVLPPETTPQAKKKKKQELGSAGLVGLVGLDEVLEGVKDVSIPVQNTVGEMTSVPFTTEETTHIVTNVLSRINDSAKWDLRLVSIERVVKVVDPYKTVYYTLTFFAYSPLRNVATRLVADVVVPESNAMYVARVRQYSSRDKEDGEPRGSRGPHTEAIHAGWTPLIRPLA